MSETIIDTGTIEVQKDLDARGLNCPLPILKAKKALAELASGDVLRIVATDTGSVRDFQAFAKQTGNALLAHTNINGEFTFWLRRKYPRTRIANHPARRAGHSVSVSGAAHNHSALPPFFSENTITQ